MPTSPPSGLAPAPALVDPQPRYRIGAVARMLRMPVATLRVWERRYQVTRPDTSASGHRLYSVAEVQRLGLLRQLVSLGHAVGALAHLDMAGLHSVAATHARAVAQPVPAAAGPGRPLLPAADLAGQVQPADDTGWQHLVQAWLNPAGRALHAAADTLPEVPPRRYSDATLTDLAALSTTIVCECPAHVAELLMALSHFEAYSAECAHRSPADAAVHQHLQRVAGTARALFEHALARLAVHEGLILPESG